jgi:hypothetical protein
MHGMMYVNATWHAVRMHCIWAHACMHAGPFSPSSPFGRQLSTPMPFRPAWPLPYALPIRQARPDCICMWPACQIFHVPGAVRRSTCNAMCTPVLHHTHPSMRACAHLPHLRTGSLGACARHALTLTPCHGTACRAAYGRPQGSAPVRPPAGGCAHVHAHRARAGLFWMCLHAPMRPDAHVASLCHHAWQCLGRARTAAAAAPPCHDG